MEPASVDQWQNDIRAYNEEYEKLYLDIKTRTSGAMKAMRHIANPTILSECAVELNLLNMKLVEVRGMALLLFRGAKNFYEITKWKEKARLIKEKKLAAGVAENEAQGLLIEEFDCMNEAEYNFERVDKLWLSTDRMVEALLTKLDYASAKSHDRGTESTVKGT